MRKALTALVAASAVAFTVVFTPLATTTSAASCDDIKFIFARGSGQPLSDEDYINFRKEIISELKLRKSNLKYSFYELGSSSHGGAKYPAVALNFFNTIAAKISAGTAASYGKSVEQGIAELKSYISETNLGCKNTKFVLGGYSQGAQVITTTIPDLNPDKIVYAATFGDPKLYLPEGEGKQPDACLGKNLSPYREFAPNCYTAAGSLGAKKPYQPNNWRGKIGLWCKDKDLVCGAGIDISGGEGIDPFSRIISGALSSHTSYPEDGIFVLAAKTIAKKLQKAIPSKVPKLSSSVLNRDTVILIDRTASMSPYIDSYKQEALRLAQSTIADGGRIALYTYGDLEEEKPVRLVDFGASIEEFQDALKNISVNGGGDTPESMLSALITVMNSQSWRTGATKSITVLTDAPYLDPDRDGTTLAAVQQRSLEIDPVNVYIVSTAVSYRQSFELLTSATGGIYFDTLGSFSTDYLLARPNVNFPLAEYRGAPGDSFNFEILTDENISSYEWDLDFDGIFETTTTIPTVTKSYTSPQTGFIQARITTTSGNTSTASAKVVITDEKIAPASIEDIVTSSDENTATISFRFTGSAIAALITIDDTSLGFTNQNQLIITDLTKPVTLTLTALSSTGKFDSSTSLTLAPLGKSTSSTNSSADTTSSATPNSSATASSSASSSDSNSSPAIPLAPNSGVR